MNRTPITSATVKLGATLALCLATSLSVPAFAETGIQVVMNKAKIVKLARSADTIVIGNPEIADAVVQDATTIVLTGKGFGVTNLVVLDSEGKPIVDEEVIVKRDSSSSLRVYRRADVQTLSCTPFCEGAFKSEAEQASDSAIGGSGG